MYVCNMFHLGYAIIQTIIQRKVSMQYYTNVRQVQCVTESHSFTRACQMATYARGLLRRSAGE